MRARVQAITTEVPPSISYGGVVNNGDGTYTFTYDVTSGTPVVKKWKLYSTCFKNQIRRSHSSSMGHNLRRLHTRLQHQQRPRLHRIQTRIQRTIHQRHDKNILHNPEHILLRRNTRRRRRLRNTLAIRQRRRRHHNRTNVPTRHGHTGDTSRSHRPTDVTTSCSGIVRSLQEEPDINQTSLKRRIF